MADPPFEIPEGVIRQLSIAQHVVVLTGAGTSTESGVPTFRDALTGLWAKYDPQELATPQAFRRNPRLVWEWYAWRRNLVSTVKPNPGHYALTAIEEHVPDFTLITQNVDGLHQRAGSENIIELHGNLFRVKCFDEGRIIEQWDETEELPPRCPFCGGLLRPDVVWFGEMLPVSALQRAIQVSRAADIFLTIGTSALVQPAASLPLDAVENGAMLIEININETPLSAWMSHTLIGPSGIVLPALVAATWP